MFSFKDHPLGTPFWHGKLFTLEWDLKDYRWVLIRFHNDQRKPWYRTTERSYRFKRWFFRSSRGEFSNLANIFSPKIEIYLLPWYLIAFKKVVIPMRVHRITTADIPFQLVAPNAELDFPICIQKPSNLALNSTEIITQIASPSVNLKAPRLQLNMKIVMPGT